MVAKLGVGFLGAGPVTQAIHLPTLAWLTDRFEVVRVMDVDAAVASVVADRCGAASTTSADEVIADPAVQIVAICSPNAFHADQVIAACVAGKRAVLCEKPLAVSREEARAIRSAAERSGTAIVVGTMHAYDPAFRAAQRAWQDSGEQAEIVRSSIYLPANNVYIDQATELTASQDSPARGRPSPEIMMRNAVLGLAIHNIPLVRDFYPDLGNVKAASFIAPFGYSITAANDRQAAQFLALMPGSWQHHWSFAASSPRASLQVSFPPSYVLAGAAKAELTIDGKTRIFSHHENGYEKLWLHLDDICRGRSGPAISLSTAIADLEFALDMAEAAESFVRLEA